MRSISMLLLVLAVILILLLGVIGIVAIFFVARRCRHSLMQKQDSSDIHKDDVDPWVEAGKRVNCDLHEPE